MGMEQEMAEKYRCLLSYFRSIGRHLIKKRHKGVLGVEVCMEKRPFWIGT